MYVISGLQLRGLSGKYGQGKTFLKVREKSGNFIFSQGILTF